MTTQPFPSPLHPLHAIRIRLARKPLNRRWVILPLIAAALLTVGYLGARMDQLAAATSAQVLGSTQDLGNTPVFNAQTTPNGRAYKQHADGHFQPLFLDH
ncbi:MAG: hypothetical protein JWM80_3835 [Cyanobacteria bacterium RYN_339]|nr:hypothetical protein [Cyanobacteria bacterium RYN_339]